MSSWARSEQEALEWCSRTDVPIPAAVISGWAAAPDVAAYALVDDDGQLVGYGELWIDDDEVEVELARLIIDPSRRGSGYGSRLVTGLVTQAQRHHPSVTLRVHPDNTVAQRVYTKAGFVPVSPTEEAEWNAGQPLAYRWMTYRGP